MGIPFSSDGFHDVLSLPAKAKRKVEPCPGCDSTEMLPPCRSTIFLQMANPMPVPANSSRLCSRWNMPKILSKYCGSIPSPLSLHREDPFLPAIPGGGDVYLRDSGALVLDGVADEVLKQLNQLHLVRQDGGQRIVRHQRAAFLDGAAQIDERLLQRLFAGGIEQLLSLCPDARIGQQILDQPLHAVGAVHGERNELVGIGVQLALVAPGQKLRVAGHHAQRLLQIVRGDVGKLPQFLVRAVQLLHLLQKMRFGLSCAR